MKRLKYNHPAVPKNGIEMNKTYSLEELEKLFSLEQVKTMFIPINFQLEEDKVEIIEENNTSEIVEEVIQPKQFHKKNKHK